MTYLHFIVYTLCLSQLTMVYIWASNLSYRQDKIDKLFETEKAKYIAEYKAETIDTNFVKDQAKQALQDILHDLNHTQYRILRDLEKYDNRYYSRYAPENTTESDLKIYRIIKRIDETLNASLEDSIKRQIQSCNYEAKRDFIEKIEKDIAIAIDTLITKKYQEYWEKQFFMSKDKE